MNDLIKIHAGKDFKSSFNLDFKDFFVQVCKLKVEANREELRILREYVKLFVPTYGPSAITYLCDCIDTEMCIPCKMEERNHSEHNMVSYIVKNFTKIFPDYTFISTEFKMPKIGRVDIYAKCNTRPVIIEVKSKHKNPNLQLLAYAVQAKNPILIGITEEELPFELKLPFIEYLTFDELLKANGVLPTIEKENV